MDRQAQDQIVVVPTGGYQEEVLAACLEEIGHAQDLAVEVFFPKRKMKKRYRGKWNTITEKLFPGYLFIETQDPEGLFREINQMPQRSRLPGSGELHYFTLNPEEEAFVRWVGHGRDDHCIGISTVQIAVDTPYKKGDQVDVLSGDLKDFEEEIVGFNFHKRKAMIQTQMFGGKVIHVGIELAG